MKQSLLILILSVFLTGCTVEPNNNSRTTSTAPTPAPSASATAATAKAEPSPSATPNGEMLPGPNAIPTDTRVVVNIPALVMLVALLRNAPTTAETSRVPSIEAPSARDTG